MLIDTQLKIMWVLVLIIEMSKKNSKYSLSIYNYGSVAISLNYVVVNFFMQILWLIKRKYIKREWERAKHGGRHFYLIPAAGAICELAASLVYIANSRLTRDT